MTFKEPHKAYDPIVDTYVSGGEEDPELRARCRELLQALLPGKRILEVGCGPGIDAVALSEEGMEVTAIDLSSEFIDYAKRTHSGVDFRCMDMRTPDFEHGSFDGILGMACFCHLTPEEASSSLHRYNKLLGNGGAIGLWLMDSMMVESYVVEDWSGVEENRVKMICHDRDRIDTELKTAGFEGIEMIPLHSPYYEAMPRIQENAASLYFATGIKS